MKPTRQIECVELMVATNNVTVTYANALLAATPATMLVAERKPKKLAGVSAEQMAKMEKEMGNLQGQYKSIEHTYGQDVLNLVLAKGLRGAFRATDLPSVPRLSMILRACSNWLPRSWPVS